jgi:hypothetical protein
VAAPLVTIGGPVFLGLMGAIRNRRAARTSADDDPAWDWRLTASSALLYALAFSLIFDQVAIVPGRSDRDRNFVDSGGCSVPDLSTVLRPGIAFF